jgi:hypothetical protein
VPGMWLATGEIERLAAELEPKRAAFEAGALTWQSWNNFYCTTATTSNTLPVSLTWQSWNTTYTTGSNAYLYDATSNTAMVAPQWTGWNTAYEETEEQKAGREAARAEYQRRKAESDADWRRRQEEQQRKREEADARAALLLRSLLTDAQWASYQENGWFEVTGSKGGRWRIRNRGQAGNVDLMPEIGEERDATYCAHPPGGLPDADAHAAQMLALVTDEEAFVKTANVHWRRPGTTPPLLRAVA